MAIMPAWRRRSEREPTGLARVQEKGLRFCSERDSGRTKRPYIPLTRLRPPATQKGRRGLMFPRRPPTAGPRTKATPEAECQMAKAAARRSRGGGTAKVAMGVGVVRG